MKIGIIQGRLSEPKEGFQECPVELQYEKLINDNLVGGALIFNGVKNV